MAKMSITINASFDNILEIAKEISELQTYKLFPDDNMLLVERDDVVEVLKRHVKRGSAPTISPDEVRGVGHWVTEQEAIDANDYSLRDTCSVCGHCDWDCTESANFKYCPNCGARMRGVSGDV